MALDVWDKEQVGDAVITTAYDPDQGRVFQFTEQDVSLAAKQAQELQKQFRGYDSEVCNLVASIPINLHNYWLRVEGYDFTDFEANPWPKTVKKIKEANLEDFFTVPNGGYSG